MNRYKVTKVLGDGTYGSVLRAQNKSTGEWVAIKKMKQKYYSWEECMKLREINSLRKLLHPNIVKLKEVIRENDELHLVFEFMEANLYEYMKARVRPLPESRVRNIMFQTLQAVHHVHKNGYFHRDMKPENLLVSGDTVKLADFGLAREIRARPPFTDYVSTRWYRAPEVLLRSSVYNSPLDVWACGGIMAELYTLRPLFPGSSESDQLYKICSVLGTPTQAQWPDGFRLASQIGFRFPQFTATKFEGIVPQSGPDGINLMLAMMSWDPNKRISTAKILAHPYFEAGSITEVAANPSNQLPQLPEARSEAPSALQAAAPRAMPSQLKPAVPSLPVNGFSAGDQLFNTKGSWHDNIPASGRKAAAEPLPSFGAPSFGAAGKENASGSKGFNLPSLGQPEGRKSSGAGKTKSPGARYLKMARYQPGMQQMPQLPSVSVNGVKPMAGLQAPGGSSAFNALPALSGVRQERPELREAAPMAPKPTGYFGAHAARMLG